MLHRERPSQAGSSSGASATRKLPTAAAAVATRAAAAEPGAEAAADPVGEVLAVEEGRGAEARMHARRNGAQAPSVAGAASASRHRRRHTGTVYALVNPAS